MKTLSLSEAKMRLSGPVEAVCSRDEEVVITRNGSPAADPASGIRIEDERGDLRSFCAGKLRIVYRVREKDVSEILAIGPRGVIYEETYRLLCWKVTK